MLDPEDGKEKNLLKASIDAGTSVFKDDTKFLVIPIHKLFDRGTPTCHKGIGFGGLSGDVELVDLDVPGCDKGPLCELCSIEKKNSEGGWIY